MLLPDTNIWLALALADHEFHIPSQQWLASHSRRSSIAFCRATQQSFLRYLTTDAFMRLYNTPSFTNAGAWEFLESILSDPRIAFAPEPTNLDATWKRLAARNTPSPKLWMDAYLAAFALAGNHQLVTTDKAFSQFKDLHPLLLTSNL